MSIYDLDAYELILKEDLSDLKSKGSLLRHKKTGARVLLMENDDENKVFSLSLIHSLCTPAICEMWVYFFVNSLVTVSAVVFLFTPTAPIASVAIVSLEGAGQTAPAVAMCMLLLFINLIVRGLYEASRHKGQKAGLSS